MFIVCRTVIGVSLAFPILSFAVNAADPASGAAEKRSPKAKAAYENGRKQAQEEIARHVLAYQQFGLPAPWMPEYVALLRRDYHIDLRLGGCVITEDALGFQQGFNEVMFAEIEKRYGQEALRRAAEEARKRYQERVSAAGAGAK